jgi:ADP-ribosylglycohydrolase
MGSVASHRFYLRCRDMLGAIAGDISGSRFEFDPIKTTEFDLFTPECSWTDDTVLTLAVADALMNGLDMAAALRRWVLISARVIYREDTNSRSIQ